MQNIPVLNFARLSELTSHFCAQLHTMFFLHSCIPTLNDFILYTYLDKLFCTNFLYEFAVELQGFI